MTVPRADSTIAARVKKLEDELRRIKLAASIVQSADAPTAVVKNSVWYDASAGNEPKVFNGTEWVPVRDQTIAVAQQTADTAQATVDPLVPLTDLAAVTNGTTVTGATQATSGTGPRVVINDPAYPGEIVLYTGAVDEEQPARIKPIVSGASYLQLIGPKITGSGAPATAQLSGGLAGGLTGFEVDADSQHIYATTMTIDGFTSFRLGDGTNYLNIVGDAIQNADLSSATNTFPASMLPPADSGWVDLTPSAGWAHSAYTGVATAQCRKIGNRVHFRGSLSGTSLAVNTTTAIAQVPAGYYNGLQRNFRSLGTTGGFIGWGNVTETGVLQVHFKSPWTTAAAVIDVSGMSYLMD